MKYRVGDNIIHAKAEKYFGTTDDYSEAGYLTPNGHFLDFSGKKFGGHGSVRHMDHNEISIMFEDDDVEYPKIEYMKLGGIRIGPESLSAESKVEPTSQQYAALRRFFNDTYGSHTVDLYDPETGEKYGKIYNKDVSGDKIVDDIKRFYSGESMAEEDDNYYVSESYIPLFEDFNAKEIRFKLAPEKFKEMYDNVYLGIHEETDEDINRAKNILWSLKDKNYYITKSEYDLIQTVIARNKAKKGEHYVPYEGDIVPSQKITIKKFGEFDSPKPSIDPAPVKDKYTEYIPVGAMESFWKKLTTTDHKLKQFVDRLFNKIQKRPTAMFNNKQCYPVTSREMSVLNDFKEGRLTPRNFPATY